MTREWTPNKNLGQERGERKTTDTGQNEKQQIQDRTKNNRHRAERKTTDTGQYREKIEQIQRSNSGESTGAELARKINKKGEFTG